MANNLNFKNFAIETLLDEAETLFNDNLLEYKDYESFQFVMHKLKEQR